VADDTSGIYTPAPFSVYLKTLAGPDRESVTFDGGEDLLMRRFELVEELHRPYAMDVRVLASNPEIDVPGLVGGDFELLFHGFEEQRSVRGVVLEATLLGAFNHKMHIDLKVGPAVSLLRNFHRSRIFQDLNVISIAEKVTKEVFKERSRKLNTSLLDASKYPVRDYCVQFREDDLTFLQRIFAEEGLTFAFSHDGDAEEMVLLPGESTFVAVGDSFTEGSGEKDYFVPVAVGIARGQVDGDEWIRRLEWSQQHAPKAAQTEAWDWKSPQYGQLSKRHEANDVHPFTNGEVFEHDFRRTTEQDRGDGDHLDETEARVLRQFRRMHGVGEVFTGTSTITMLAPGKIFTPTGYPHPHLEGPVYTVAVIHRGNSPEVDPHAPAREDSGYINEFRCVRAEVPYIPPHIPKPRVYGPQTAIVVGPSGEEIYTDEHARIKARFHFDREQRSQTSDTSCWLRVAQAWAGPGWGALFIPRVGMEVVVNFLDGDPDRPLVTGAVYNKQNPPPYALPDERTKSTIKSNSSPGGGGFNEFRFEDAAGAEQVFLHAQKDLSEKVLDAHDMSVGTTQTIDVGSDQKITIGGNRSLTVTGNHSIKIKSSPKQGEGEPPPAFEGQETEIDGDHKTRIHKTSFIHATDSMELKVGGDAVYSTITILPDSITLSVNNGAKVTIDADFLAEAKASAAYALITHAPSLELVTAGNCAFALDERAFLKTKLGSQLEVTDSLTLDVPNSASIKALQNVEFTCNNKFGSYVGPSKFVVTAADATLSSLTNTLDSNGLGTVQTGPLGVSLDGINCDVLGKAKVSIKGIMVGLNS